MTHVQEKILKGLEAQCKKHLLKIQMLSAKFDREHKEATQAFQDASVKLQAYIKRIDQ